MVRALALFLALTCAGPAAACRLALLLALDVSSSVDAREDQLQRGGLAAALVAPEVVAACRRLSNHNVYNLPEAMQRVALAAVRHGDVWIEASREAYRAARDACVAALDEAGIPHSGAAGGSFVFADLRETLGERPLEGLLEASIAEGVLVAPGGAMGDGYEGHVRICFTGVPEAEVVDGVKRLARAAASF
ncbi:MAG: aminotransferase class I/II-fold pyridoxal phosphate-dependent enzyme [Pseudomonadota bacterium]